ncbi:LacI family DNA-binding transcriptional regulator [Paenibacillus arenilitoris]|uniref:LacI family DNA-binding transcriptional regulator n=1 Tax=Paenibacillus arenilitoris TaxID=2772299 RepID=A0A927CPF8_9BACL|nr:LacI family DNA-binding transcriptional regulator [Paenibacillus arenilitoris]MBD2869305.1 LacI family DNA-binding transcriptional regulator [Paenibacillus arenilitoris]
MRKKVTMQEIADMVGVSKFAVSRALSSKPGVSPQTKETILKAAGQLGYFSGGGNNEPVKSTFKSGIQLRPAQQSGLSGSIVILFPNIRHQNRDNVYWGPVFDGIMNRLNQETLDIVTLTEPSTDNMFSLLNPDAIRGIISIGSISTQILLDIGRLNIPVTMVDHADPAFQCDTVFTDNFGGMRKLMTKLISKGYRKYQFVGSIKDAPSYYERWIAFKTTLEEHDIELKQDPLLIGPEAVDIYMMMPKLSLDELPEVFVCAHDSSAAFMVEELQKRGIQVPRDCGVTGFDNTNDTHPILATVNVNMELLGIRAVDQMIWRIMNPDTAPERKLIAGELLVREQYAMQLDD